VAKDDMAIVVKTNMYDGFKSGMHEEECIKVAQELERLGVHALVLTAGFVSKAPMEVMRGAMPYKTLAHYMNIWKFWWLRMGIRMFGKWVIPAVPYKEVFFLETAKKFRKELKIPLIYVGGILSKENMEEVLEEGFIAFQMARVLIHDTDFIKKIQDETVTRSECKHSNYCIGRMYTLDMKCHHCVDNLPKKLQKEIKKAEK
ncbi:MAG: NADH:flavin oxidoreductase, partial [Bacteroidales bacterium]